MNDKQNPQPDESQLPALQRLTEALRRLHRLDFRVPPEADDAIRAMIRQHFSAKKRVRRVAGWLSAAAAAAAVLLVMFWSGSPLRPPVGDIDASGQVDILDAFAVARAIDRSSPTRREWDVNGDSVVNRADADAIAMSAVRLDKGRVQ